MSAWANFGGPSNWRSLRDGADLPSEPRHSPSAAAPWKEPPPSRPPMNWKFSTTTDSLLRLPPCLSSHVSYFSRPWTKSGLPLSQYWAMTSACLPKAAQSTKQVSSLSSPPAVRYLRLTARPKSATCEPLGRALSCGSRVTFPISSTWLKLGITPPGNRKVRDCEQGGGHVEGPP